MNRVSLYLRDILNETKFNDTIATPIVGGWNYDLV